MRDYEVFPEREEGPGAIYIEAAKSGKVHGEASANALVNLVESGVLTQEWVDNYLKLSQEKDNTSSPSSVSNKKAV